MLDAATWNDDARTTAGGIVHGGDTLTRTGDLAVGQVVTITYSVSVTAAGPAELRNVVTSSDERALCDPTGACLTSHEVPSPPLAGTGSTIAGAAGTLALLMLLVGSIALRLHRRATTRSDRGTERARADAPRVTPA